jgi:DNA-binding transcriptional MerR regulator
MTQIISKYSPKEAMQLCGFKTVAMIDYLQRHAIFKPERVKGRQRGKRREFTFKDLLVLKAIKRLLDSGASVALLKKSLQDFQATRWSADPVTLEEQGQIIRYLFVSADSIYLRKDADSLIDLSKKGQLTFSFIIDLENLRTELRTSLGLPTIQSEFTFVQNGEDSELKTA